MKLFLSLLVLLSFNSHVFANPIPVSKLDKEILKEFIPLINEEMEKEFALQDDQRTHRFTREYGYGFFKLENGNQDYTPIPAFFQDLGDKVCKKFGHPYQFFTNVILSYYDEGFHLEPHEDVNDSMPLLKGYFFDENVYGLIVEADKTGHLYFVKDEINSVPSLNLNPIYSLKEEPGTIYCLQGQYRKAPYFHGVTRVAKKRVSITFRKVIFPLNNS
jgi:hypothetical protein